MKKLVSLALAATLALSSMSGVFARTINGNQVPDEVNVSFENKIGTSLSTLGDYATPETALVVNGRPTAKFDARATIDMTEFAQTWNDYIEASGVPHDFAVEWVGLYDNTEFTVKVVVDDAISMGASNIVWSENVRDLFVEKPDSRSIVTADGKTTVTLVMIINEEALNEGLDTYFTGILADPQTADPIMTLTFEDAVLAGTEGVAYKIETEFSGAVTLDVPDFVNFDEDPVGNSQMTVSVESDEKDVNWVKRTYTTGGGGGGRPIATPVPTQTPVPTETPVPTDEPEETLVPIIPLCLEPEIEGTLTGARLNYDDHYAYIIGYDPLPNGDVEVRPTNRITRAEVATIFYRMLDADSRVKFKTADNSFTDVAAEDWFNVAVSTVAAAGIVEGYGDGTFGPNEYITRAEFATIASRFSRQVYEGGPLFTDVKGHWAEDYINSAAVTGWVTGYDDRSYRPDNDITRAEAITLINRVLYRLVENEGLMATDVYLDFADLSKDAWYYAAMVEATNSHEYTREKLGTLEQHIRVTAAPDWNSDQWTTEITDATETE